MTAAGNTAGSGAHELGEHPRDGGFRRVSRVPEPLALARMRALVLEVAAGGADMLEDGLAGFQQWRFFATLCGSAWAAGARRDSRAARRLLQRRLRVLGTRPIPLATAVTLPPGSPVHVAGIARAMPGSGVESHIWFVSATSTGSVRVLVEEGRDFLVYDRSG